MQYKLQKNMSSINTSGFLIFFHAFCICISLLSFFVFIKRILVIPQLTRLGTMFVFRIFSLYSRSFCCNTSLWNNTIHTHTHTQTIIAEGVCQSLFPNIYYLLPVFQLGHDYCHPNNLTSNPASPITCLILRLLPYPHTCLSHANTWEHLGTPNLPLVPSHSISEGEW